MEYKEKQRQDFVSPLDLTEAVNKHGLTLLPLSMPHPPSPTKAISKTSQSARKKNQAIFERVVGYRTVWTYNPNHKKNPYLLFEKQPGKRLHKKETARQSIKKGAIQKIKN